MQELPAPELTGISGWLNTKAPPSMKKLRGRVVLVDFWTYSCINCVRTLPHLNKWHRKYSKHGLVIVGVHSPEFGFEKDIANVKKAAKRHGIRYTIGLDNEMKTWMAYQNKFWPCHYIIDSKGKIRHIHAGEGAYAETELWILKLLSEMGTTIKSKIERTERAGYNINTTLETYCGSKRGQIANSSLTGVYADPGRHDVGKVYLNGNWKQEKEYVENTGKGDAVILFRAKKVNIVMSPVEGAASVRILIDNAPVGKNSGGAVKNNSVAVEVPDIYNVYKAETFGTHELKIIADKPVKLYSFTFG